MNFALLVCLCAAALLVTAVHFEKMKMVIRQCREAVSSNTCEYFATWHFTTAICTMVTAKGMMWSGFIRTMRPEFKCPVKAECRNLVWDDEEKLPEGGTYRLDNATIDVSLAETLAHINIAGNVWVVEVSLVDQDGDLFSCMKTAVHINHVNIKE